MPTRELSVSTIIKEKLSNFSPVNPNQFERGCCLPPPPPYKSSWNQASRPKDDKVPSRSPKNSPETQSWTRSLSFTGNAVSAAPNRSPLDPRLPSSSAYLGPPTETRFNEARSKERAGSWSIDQTRRAHPSRSDILMLTSHHQRVNALKNNNELYSSSSHGSTFSSPRSSISTLASSCELRQLMSPYSGCSCAPSPALVGCADCGGCRGAACSPASSSSTACCRRSFVCPSPADTVIIHEENTQCHRQSSSRSSTSLSQRALLTNTNTGFLPTCHHQNQHFNGPSVTSPHRHHQNPTPPSTGPTMISTRNTNLSLPSSRRSPVSPVNSARKTTYLPALTTLAETPTLSSYNPATMNGTTVPMPTGQAHGHNKLRDISAPVFSQPCSEDFEDPPPYKPPQAAVARKLRVPLNFVTEDEKKERNAEVEKKMEILTKELAGNSLEEDEEAFDDEEYFGQCYLCGERVIGVENACQAMQNLYHTNCFICTICGRVLRGKAFYHVKGKIMCEEDYLYSGFQISADKCAACGHLIMDMILQALGKTYHPGCFRCCVCNKALDGVPFTLDVEGKIYCIEDFRDAFAPKCARCNLPITAMENSGETVRVVSMERDFHVDCYSCEDCGLQLTDNPKEHRCYPLDGHLLCYGCHNKRRERSSRMSVQLPMSRSSSSVSGTAGPNATATQLPHASHREHFSKNRFPSALSSSCSRPA